MGKTASIGFLCSCLFLMMLCCPVRSFAKHGLRSAEAARGASRKHHSFSNRRTWLRASMRGRFRTERQWAGAKRTRLAAGEELAAAGADGAAARDDENDEYMEYRIKQGDTLEKLSRLFHFEKDEFSDLNGVIGRRLKPGTTVFIPKAQEAEDDSPIALNDRPLRPWKSEEERGILVKVAKSFAGAPYRYGGTSVRGLDCSAFVKKMYEIFEVQLPRSARDQFCAYPKVSKEDLVVGDLVFFRTRPFAHYPTHVGIYIGDNCFIHASSVFGRGVKVDRLNEAYFSRTFVGAVRVKSAPPDDADQEQIKPSSNT